jgi:hypothetical protein
MMTLRSFSAAAAASSVLVALLSCNQRPVYRANATLGGTVTGPGRDAGPLPDRPDFNLPDPPNSSSDAAGEARACGFEKFQLERVPPSLMLVLDRSSSMGRAVVGGAVGATLWTETLGALDEVVMGTQMGVKWGLKLFPLPDGCQVSGGAEVPVASNNYDMVVGRARTDGFNENGQGGTPTNSAVDTAVGYLRTLTDSNPKFIVLATDGEPTCPMGASEGSRILAVEAVQNAATAGFKVYVIGLAIQPEGEQTLNQMAVAGGVPRSDPTTRFYPVANRADLTRTLGDIAGQITTCVFNLTRAPPAPDSVKVTIDGERVPESATDGWSYTSAQHTAIQLNGSWCERLRMKAGQVDIVLGCPGVVIP